MTALYKEKLRISLEADQETLGKYGSKSSAIVKASEKGLVFPAYKLQNAKRFCHTTIEPFFDLERSYLSNGWGAVNIVSLLQQIREGGFLKYWIGRRFFDYERVLRIDVEKPKLEASNVSPTALKGKIRHLFEIYAIGNCLAMVWFIVRYVQVFSDKYFKTTPRFCW